MESAVHRLPLLLLASATLVATAGGAAALVLAETKAPVAPRKVDVLVHVASPRQALPKLRSALSVLGQRAPSLRPDGLGRDLGEPLGVDALSADELDAAGVDLDRPVSAFDVAGAQHACLSAKKGVDLRPRLDAWLARRGVRGAEEKTKVARSAQGVIVAGYAVRGTRACVYTGGGDGAAAVKRLGEVLARPKVPAGYASASIGLAGEIGVYIAAIPAAFAIDASTTAVKADGRVVRAVFAPAHGADPYAAFSPEGILAARALLSQKFLADRSSPARGALAWVLARVCRSCPSEAVAADANRVVDAMAGPAALFVSSFKVPGGVSAAPGAWYHLFPHAYVAVARDADAAARVVSGLASGLKRRGVALETAVAGGVERYSAPLGQGRIWFGARGEHLFVGNDDAAAATALAALGEPGPAKSAAAARVSLPAAGRDLGRLSILDIGRAPELAGAFAVALELGSTMRASGPIAVLADPDGSATRVRIEWALPASVP